MIPVSVWLGAGVATAGAVALALVATTAYSRGYDNGETDLRKELAEATNVALIEVNEAWERRLDVERERADFFRDDALRAQVTLDNVRRETADDVRDAIRGLSDVFTNDTGVCDLGADFVGLHNTATGNSNDPGTVTAAE